MMIDDDDQITIESILLKKTISDGIAPPFKLLALVKLLCCFHCFKLIGCFDCMTDWTGIGSYKGPTTIARAPVVSIENITKSIPSRINQQR